MNNEINLLYSKKQLRLYKLTTRVQVLRFIALGLLFFICGLSIVFFLFVIASPLTSLKQEEKALIQTLSGSKEKIVQHTLLITRLTEVEAITKKRSQYDTVLKTVRSVLPGEAEIGEFTAEKKNAQISVSSSSLEDIELTFSKLKSLVQTNNTFSQVFMNSLSTSVDLDGNITGFTARLILSIR